MSALLAIVLAAASATAAPATKAPKAPETTRITSKSADYDREAGMAMFDGDVRVEHAGEYTMNADSVYAVMASSNELRRVVAVGGVTITNAARVGTCAMAKYSRAGRMIEMFGDGKGARARLVDAGGGRHDELEGDRIRFWLDAEQVEVENSTITTGRKEGMKLL